MRSASVVYYAVVVTVLTAHALLGSSDTIAPVLVVLGLAAAAAAVWGVHHYDAGERSPWITPFALSLIFFVLADASRDTIGYADITGGGVAPDLFTLAAYTCLLIGAYSVLYAGSRIAGGLDAVLDLASLIPGSIVLAWSVLISPTLRDTAWPSAFKATVVTLFPILDVVLLVLLVYSILRNGRGTPAVRLVQLSIGWIVSADLMIAAAAAGVITVPDAVLETPFLLAIAAFGGAMLEPSMVDIGAVRSSPIDPDKQRRRSLAMTTIILVGAMGVTVSNSLPTVDRIIAGVLFTALLALSLVRSELAIRTTRTDARLASRRADHDHLTGLANREVLLRALASRTGREPVSVVFVDIDDFKSVNDRYGHAVGDALLAALAERLRTAIPPLDIAARFGGDEFVLLIHADADHAKQVADRLAAVIAEPFVLDDMAINVTVSVGVAGVPAVVPTPEPTMLIARADRAMYQAKRHHHEHVVVARPPAAPGSARHRIARPVP